MENTDGASNEYSYFWDSWIFVYYFLTHLDSLIW